MNRSALLLTVLVSTLAWAAPPSGVLCPLEVQPHPKLKPLTEQLQKRFFSAARDTSGMNLALRLEAETAIGASGLHDFKTNDASLARLAQLAKVLYAGYATLLLSPKNELVLTARIVRDDGEVVATAQALAPRGKAAIPEELVALTEKLFVDLRTKELPDVKPSVAPKAPVVVVEVKQVEEAKPPAAVEPPPPPPPLLEIAGEPASKPGSNLRPIGFGVAGAGAALAAGGAILYATAGTVRRDPATGNVYFEDVAKVTEVRTKQGVGLGLLVGGGVMAGAGLVMALLFATPAPATVAVVPTQDGAVLSLGGEF